MKALVLTNGKVTAVYKDGLMIAFAKDEETSKGVVFCTDIFHAFGGKGVLPKLPTSPLPAQKLLRSMNVDTTSETNPNLKQFPGVIK